ncbi:MAG: hypothetical protein WDO13_19040 [Verrucomicrobiota bacterium]
MKASETPAEGDSGVIDDNVKPPRFGKDAVDRRFNRVRVGYIKLD